MNLFQALVGWLLLDERGGYVAKQRKRYRHQKQPSELQEVVGKICSHDRHKRDFRVKVLGKEYRIEKSPMCLTCTREYLNRFSTICAVCRHPIFPYTSVGEALYGTPHAFTHLACCAKTGQLYCGEWGLGRLITPQEINARL